MEDEELPEIEMVMPPDDTSALLQDGMAIIFDTWELCEATNSLSAMMVGRDIFVLQRDTFQWVNVTSLGKKAVGKLQSIKKPDA